MNRILTATAAAAAFAGAAFAETFPDADGSHDFTSPAAWGTAALPGDVSFGGDVAGATYNAATGDASFTTLTLLSGLRTLDLSATPGRRISLTQAVNGDALAIGGSSTNEIRGGVWDFVNGSDLIFKSESGGSRNAQLTISGGAVLTNVADITVSAASSASNRLVICDGAAVYSDISSKDDKATRFGSGSGRPNGDGSRVEILSGGRYVVSGGYYWLYNAWTPDPVRSDFTMRVSGEGSLFKVADRGGFYMGGDLLSGDRIVVEDGGEMSLGGSFFFGYYSTANDMRVIVDGAKFSANALLVNDTASEHDDDNVMEIRNGATATVTNRATVGRNGVHGALVVSNATLTCQRVVVGNVDGGATASATNRFVLRGKDAKLNYTHTGTLNFFGTGRDNRFELTDGAEFRYDANPLYLAIMGAPTNSTLSVTDGAALRSTQTFYAGYNDGELGNRLEVGAGGTVEVKSVTIQKTGQSVVVSNGTLTCTSGRVKMIGTGCSFTLQGPDAVYEQKAVDAADGTYSLFGHNTCVTNNTWNVLDGATFAYGTKSGVYTGISSVGVHSNVVNVARGGTLRTGALFFVGYTGDSYNTVNVFDGGVLDVGTDLLVGSREQAVVVSNGTVTVARNVRLGYVQRAIVSENDRLVIAGTNSSVAVTGDLCAYESANATGATLAFVVPKGGYARTPVTAKNITLTGSSFLEVDAAAFQEGLNTTTRVALAEATASLTIPEGVLAATNERLAPKRMGVFVDGKRLVLKVRTAKAVGARLVVR